MLVMRVLYALLASLMSSLDDASDPRPALPDLYEASVTELQVWMSNPIKVLHIMCILIGRLGCRSLHKRLSSEGTHLTDILDTQDSGNRTCSRHTWPVSMK